MGQYHLPCNLDKREYLHPHELGDGLKLMEFGCSGDGTMTALALLLAASNGRGGGDFRGDDPKSLVGSWAGNRIAIIGDYYEADDVPGFDLSTGNTPWTEPALLDWRNISVDLQHLIEQDGLVKFVVEHGLVVRKRRVA